MLTTILTDASAPKQCAETVSFGQFALTPGRREITENGIPLRLGGRAMDILLILVANAGEIVSKDSLISSVWPNSVIDEGTLRVQVASLRKALGDGTDGRRYITNIAQRGYCFVAPLSDLPADNTLKAGPLANSSTKFLSPLKIRLIGRDAVIKATSELLSTRHFVTLVGPGGMGKTSVAHAVVFMRNHDYPDGSYLVDLDTISNPSLVSSAIASALGLSILSNDPTPHILSFLKDKRLVLLLDNCEHMVARVAQLAEEIMQNAANVDILATSREPLQARGEWVQRLGQLCSPAPDVLINASDALSFPAVDLFVERTRASMDSFAFNDDNVFHIAQICRRLDGIPLAIELVARRVGLFGLHTLADMLDEKLSLLTHGYRTALPRHKTLHATLDWSYGLLTETEQALLCCLSVFRESFSLGSAIKIANGVHIDTIDATEGMANLVDKSLVVATAGMREVSYRMLNTTRNYASLKLKNFAFGANVKRHHALLMNEILAAAEEELRTTKINLNDWCHENNRRIDDIRAALEWAFSEIGDKSLGADLVLTSAPIWFQLLLLNEYLGWLNATLAIDAIIGHSPHRHIRLTLAIGNTFLYTRGPQPETFDVLTETIKLASDFNDRPSELRAIWAKYYCHNMIGDYQSSLIQARKYGLLAQETQDCVALLTFNRMIGLSYHLNGDQELARQHITNALAPRRTINPILQGSAYQIDHLTASLTQLARILWIQGFSKQAIDTATEAVQQAEKASHVLSFAYVLAFTACPIALWSGDMDLADKYVRRLHTCTAEHSLQYWQGWADIHSLALELKKANVNIGSSPRINQIFDDTLLSEGVVDTIATMGPCFVGKKVIARTNAGMNGWCAAEVLRAQGEHALTDGRRDESEAENFFQRSIAVARGQGANYWLLKSASSLANLFQAQGRLQEAKEILLDALENYSDHDTILDVRNCRILLQKLAEAT